MTKKNCTFEHPQITLTEMLDAREARAGIQMQMQKKHPHPLICFTMNIAGPVKNSPTIHRAFSFGLNELKKSLTAFTVLEERDENLKTGPVYYCSVKGNADAVKNICTVIEESSPIGRLFDIDVLGDDGKKLERKKERCCIVCGSSGRMCAASRAHPVSELQTVTAKLIAEHFAKTDSKIIAKSAKESLLQEVATTPKPGLVDLSNNGSHKDMTPDTFQKSANALEPYFEKCVTYGIETAEESPETTFSMLRKTGHEAEKSMYKATDGVNTHKGIIYSMGIMAGAIGRLWSVDTPIADTESILNECAALAKKAVENDFENIDNSTAGGRLYLLNGEKGIRGEAEKGFISVKNISLPRYKKAIAAGKNKNDAGVITLLHLISKVYDTSIFNRGGENGVTYAREYAERLLSQPSVTNTDIEKMDEAFISKNLSPGGCADLLAITFFLDTLEYLKRKNEQENDRPS